MRSTESSTLSISRNTEGRISQTYLPVPGRRHHYILHGKRTAVEHHPLSICKETDGAWYPVCWSHTPPSDVMELRRLKLGDLTVPHIGKFLVVIGLAATLALPTAQRSPALAARSHGPAPWTVRQTLSFCAAHPHVRYQLRSVRGYYFAFLPGAGAVSYGELLRSPTQVKDVLRAHSIPAKIRFGIYIAVPLLGPHPVRNGMIRSQSWVTVTGLLSCYSSPPAEIIVRSYSSS
jgi:hypothetical protein